MTDGHRSPLPLGEAVRRAPVPLVAAVAMGLALLRSAQFEIPILNDVVLAAAVAGFLGAVCGHGLARHLGAVAIGAVAALAVVFAEPLMLSHWLLLAALALGGLVAPAVPGRLDAEEAWRALVRPAAAAGLALLGALLVIAGIYLLEVSAEALLGLDWGDITTHMVAPLALGWLAPAIFLSLSEADGDERVSEALGLIGRTFARLVLTPLLAVYAVVLAAYVGRILVVRALPVNEIGWIVPLFGGTGAITYLALASLPQKGFVSRAFLRAWFPVTIVPVALYALAVWIRIDAYGITSERYLAILVGVWLAMLAITFTLAPRSDVRLIPLTLVLVLALGAVGPWSLKPMVVKSFGDRVAAALPEGDATAVIRATLPDARSAVCDPIWPLFEVGELHRVEERLGVGDLATACAAPWEEPQPGSAPVVPLAEVLTVTTRAEAIPAEGRVWVWGPIQLYDWTRAESAEGVPLSLAVEGTTLTVRARGEVATFDLVEAARAWQRDHPAGSDAPGEPMLLGEGGITVAITDLTVSVAARGEERTFGSARLFVVAPRP